MNSIFLGLLVHILYLFHKVMELYGGNLNFNSMKPKLETSQDLKIW